MFSFQCHKKCFFQEKPFCVFVRGCKCHCVSGKAMKKCIPSMEKGIRTRVSMSWVILGGREISKFLNYLENTFENTLWLESLVFGPESVSGGFPGSPVKPSTHDKGYDKRFSICSKQREWLIDYLSSSCGQRWLTLFFLTSPVPLSAPEVWLSLSSTLKLTLEVFFRPSLLCVDIVSWLCDEACEGVSVEMTAGAIVNGGTQSELNTISASL